MNFKRFAMCCLLSVFASNFTSFAKPPEPDTKELLKRDMIPLMAAYYKILPCLLRADLNFLNNFVGTLDDEMQTADRAKSHWHVNLNHKRRQYAFLASHGIGNCRVWAESLGSFCNKRGIENRVIYFFNEDGQQGHAVVYVKGHGIVDPGQDIRNHSTTITFRPSEQYFQNFRFCGGSVIANAFCALYDNQGQFKGIQDITDTDVPIKYNFPEISYFNTQKSAVVGLSRAKIERDASKFNMSSQQFIATFSKPQK